MEAQPLTTETGAAIVDSPTLLDRFSRFGLSSWNGPGGRGTGEPRPRLTPAKRRSYGFYAGEKGTPSSRCVAGGAKLLKDQTGSRPNFAACSIRNSSKSLPVCRSAWPRRPPLRHGERARLLLPSSRRAKLSA